VQFLITDLKYGGTPRSVQALALGLRDRGYDIRVASLLSGGEIAEELRAAGIQVADIGIDQKPMQAVWGLLRLLRRDRPLILHTFLFHANLLGRIVGRLARVPLVIASERSVEPTKSVVRVLIDRFTWRFASIWTANAEAVRQVLHEREGVDRSRIAVIPTAVDIERFSPRPRNAGELDIRRRLNVQPDEILLVSVGRLDALKGHDTLVEAFRLLASSRPNIRLALVGDGRERGALEARVASAGLTARVSFIGGTADVASYLRASDLFVLASNTEGMPGALLEAMALGLPVVATSVGGTPEVVVDAVTGLLVPPRDSAALASAIGRLIDDPGLRCQMGLRARARATESFSIGRILDLTEALYTLSPKP
jgi:glycosyltransferase involved in cell wall biosynthesis